MPARLTLKDNFFESRLVLSRGVTLLVFAAVLIMILFGRLFYLQVISHEHYTTLSEDNRVKLQPIPPNRAQIFERNAPNQAEKQT